MPHLLDQYPIAIKGPPMNPRQAVSIQEAERSLWLQKVLVPLDFSAGSTVALQYAAALAREFHATVTLLHIVQLNVAGEERGVPRTQFLNELRKTGERQLRQLVDTIWAPEIAREVIVRAGRPHEEIVNVARETDAELIIMASHGNTGLLRLLRPRTAERVVRNAPCPVLVLRAAQQRFVLDLPSTKPVGVGH
jgi:universal stress protein A